VFLALEPMHAGCSSEWTFLTSLEETLELIEQLGGRLRIVFDCYHLGFEPEAAARAASLAGRIGVVHVGDGKSPPDGEQRRCRLGEGRVPLKEIVSSLSAAGYDGCFDVELMGEDVEAECYQSLLEHSRAAFERLTT
jgi:sugar phosphate isomerase/epimerase